MSREIVRIIGQISTVILDSTVDSTRPRDPDLSVESHRTKNTTT